MDKISTLWQGANYQDNLLQSYRNFHLTTQSIFIAIGVGLSVSIVSTSEINKQILLYGLLFVISSVGIYLLCKMKKLILARGQDVDYYHDQIIILEKKLSKEDRVLTAFKVYQKFNRQNVNTDDFFETFELTDKVVNELTEKGKGHTRRFLDHNLFIWFQLIWLTFHIICLISILYI
ncbi:MAG: hypothetical protein H3C41_11515 [Bacteroidales bacterium]|nr:hypothetical protein [Bacteroidales bacterium]